MESEHQVPIWFFVGGTLLVYGLIILGVGLYALVDPSIEGKVALSYLHADIWWGGFMAIMGGAILPKLMGSVADQYDMSRGFIVPLACFVFVACYGFFWPKLSGAESMSGVKTSGGH